MQRRVKVVSASSLSNVIGSFCYSRFNEPCKCFNPTTQSLRLITRAWEVLQLIVIINFSHITYHYQRFSLTRSLCYFSSIDQLLEERKANPEQILMNLGFGAYDRTIGARLPARFLASGTRANGINMHNFIQGHPELYRHLEDDSSASKWHTTNMDNNIVRLLYIVGPVTVLVRETCSQQTLFFYGGGHNSAKPFFKIL